MTPVAFILIESQVTQINLTKAMSPKYSEEIVPNIFL